MIKAFAFSYFFLIAFAAISPLNTVLIQNPNIETLIQSHSQNGGNFAYSIARTQGEILPILNPNLLSTLHLRTSVYSALTPIHAFQLHPFIHNLPVNTLIVPQGIEKPQRPNDVSIDGDSVTVEAN